MHQGVDKKTVNRLRRIDGDIVKKIALFAMSEFPKAYSNLIAQHQRAMQRAPVEFHMVLGPWLVFECSIEGEIVARRFLQSHRQLKREEKDWIRKQLESHIGVWHVSSVLAGRSLGLSRYEGKQVEAWVEEACGSQEELVGKYLLARVVKHIGCAIICGSHPFALDGESLKASGIIEHIKAELPGNNAGYFRLLESWTTVALATQYPR